MEYVALFVTALLAATLLPLPSELPLVLLVRRHDQIFAPVLVATIGNYLGACTTFALARFAVGRWTAEQRAPSRAAVLLQRYGSPALLFSWVPLIGDGIVVLAGGAGVPFATFSFWTVIGKAGRYATVAWFAARG